MWKAEYHIIVAPDIAETGNTFMVKLQDRGVALFDCSREDIVDKGTDTGFVAFGTVGHLAYKQIIVIRELSIEEEGILRPGRRC